MIIPVFWNPYPTILIFRILCFVHYVSFSICPLSYVLFFHRDVSSPRNNIIHCYAILFNVSLKRTNFLYHIRRIMNTYFLKRPYIILFHIIIKFHHPFFIFCRCSQDIFKIFYNYRNNVPHELSLFLHVL